MENKCLEIKNSIPYKTMYSMIRYIRGIDLDVKNFGELTEDFNENLYVLLRKLNYLKLDENIDNREFNLRVVNRIRQLLYIGKINLDDLLDAEKTKSVIENIR